MKWIDRIKEMIKNGTICNKCNKWILGDNENPPGNEMTCKKCAVFNQ